MLKACSTCGVPFQPTPARRSHCPVHGSDEHGPPSPSSLAARDPEYQRNRRRVLANDPPCEYCGAPATTADHRVPVVRGGTNAIGNLAAACEKCNKSKGARSAPRHELNPGVVPATAGRLA